MGTATHDADFAIVEGALARLKSVFAEHVSVELLGVSSRSRSAVLGEPYRHAGERHVVVSGLRQLDHTAALGHRASRRSPIRRSIAASRRSRRWTMRRWACRCWPRTARCTAARWPTALAAGWCRMTRTPGLWRLPAWCATPGCGSRLSDGARTAFAAGTLAAQAAGRRAAWLGLVAEEATIGARGRPGGVAGITIRFPGATGGARIG